MIVTVGNTKGGVGKTTLAVQLALNRRLAGREVLLIDADTQGSSQDAASIRAEAGRAPILTCVQLAEGKLLRSHLASLAGKYEHTLIDAGGRDNEALRVALSLTDVTLIPVQPRAVDVWALGGIARLIDQVQAARQDVGKPLVRVLAVLNLADPGENPDTTEAARALAEVPCSSRCDRHPGAAPQGGRERDGPWARGDRDAKPGRQGVRGNRGPRAACFC